FRVRTATGKQLCSRPFTLAEIPAVAPVPPVPQAVCPEAYARRSPSRPSHAVPYAAPVSGDVDPGPIQRVHRHPVSPFEIEFRDAPPGEPAIDAPPGGGFEAGGAQYPGVVGVDGDVVDVLVAIQHPAPGGAAIDGEVNAAINRALLGAAAPGGEVQVRGVARVYGQTIGPVQPGGERHHGPMLRAVGGPVDSAVARIAEPSVIAAPRHDQVESAHGIAHHAPGEGLAARDAGIVERPVFAPVGGFEDAAAEAGDVEDAGGIAQYMGGGGLRHTGILYAPGASAIVGADHAAAVGLRPRALPHLGARQIVRAAHDGPHAAADGGVELHPIGAVFPVARHAPTGGAVPTGAAGIAGPKADIGVTDEHVTRVEGVEVNAVAGRDVDAVGGPVAIRRAIGVSLVPRLAAIGGAQDAGGIGGINQIGVAWRHAEADGVARPSGTEAIGEPSVVDVAVNRRPVAPGIGGLRHAPGGAQGRAQSAVG